MIINKHIERKILTDYFFIEGKIPLIVIILYTI
ncbi:MAG: hypothetical protein CM15mV127_450 [Caudoviricetes sp.]|nr:MAG: hypothetical protein CM15mV127_450 [Caudoviricetes sp.]